MHALTSLLIADGVMRPRFGGVAAFSTMKSWGSAGSSGRSRDAGRFATSEGHTIAKSVGHALSNTLSAGGNCCTRWDAAKGGPG